jgi:hypothetical protein
MFTPAEQAMLREESYSVSKDGMTHAQPRFIPLIHNLLFSLDMFSRLVMPGFKLDISAPEWQRFLRGLEVRNRLTHPRSVQDLEVSEADLLDVHFGYKWLEAQWVTGFVTAWKSSPLLDETQQAQLDQLGSVFNPPTQD